MTLINIFRAAALAALALALLIAACGGDDAADIDRTNPSIRGVVTEKNAGASDNLGTILVKGEIEQDTDYDYASVRLTTDTAIFRSEGGELAAAAFDDITIGSRVEAWFEGPVAESYPVQATAGQIIVLE